MTRPRCKTGKVRHPTKEAGIITAKKLKNSRLNVYHCEHCKGWHLGNSNVPLRISERIGEVLEQHAKALEKRLKARPQATRADPVAVLEQVSAEASYTMDRLSDDS